jgi:uncharacterized protein (DUF4213/DUF364 family)
MSGNGVLAETVEAIQEIASKEIATIVIERAVVGLFFTAVKLSTGHVGACATPIKAIPDAVCCPSSAHAMLFPGKMRGRPAADFLDEVRQRDGIRRAVGVATMNALGSLCWERRPHPDVDLEFGVDAFDTAGLRPGQMVVVVGAFVPFLRKLKKRGQPYLVLEQDPATLNADELPFYRHAAHAPAVVPQADVLLVTGTTLVNDTLDEILAAARPDACKVVVGPTVGLVPDVYLRRGCGVLGTIRVTRGDEFLDVLAEGGSGYHFFGRSAEKVVLKSRRLATRSERADPPTRSLSVTSPMPAI